MKTITVKNILRILIGLTFVPSIQGQNVYNNEVPIDNTEIVVKNKADYSEHFIQGLQELGFQKIEMVEFGKANHTQTGQADNSSGFFFGPESNIDKQTGVGYFVTEYTDNRAKNCATQIRIGDENELAQIIKYCNGNIKDITLENFTTLHKK